MGGVGRNLAAEKSQKWEPLATRMTISAARLLFRAMRVKSYCIPGFGSLGFMG